MVIENNIIKRYLKNVYFITGTAYAGKSTMVKLLAERYDLLYFGENFHLGVSNDISSIREQPAHRYLLDLEDFRDFVTRSPEDYEAWIEASSREAAGFEVAELIAKTQDKLAIVDTNIPLEILKEITEPSRVAVMVAAASMSVERFFDRDDPEKKYILEIIESTDDPAWTLENYRAGLERINSQEKIDRYINSGYFVLQRDENSTQSIEETCDLLAEHFGFIRERLWT